MSLSTFGTHEPAIGLIRPQGADQHRRWHAGAIRDTSDHRPGVIASDRTGTDEAVA